MALSPTSAGRERILVFGGAGMGKTYDWLCLARMSQKTGSEAKFYVVDTDATVDRMLATEFAELTNVEFHPVYDWAQLVSTINEFQRGMKPDDWLVVDLLSPSWDMVQEYFCLVPETRVLTDDLRWVEVGELKHGDGLLGFDENKEPGNKCRDWKGATVINPEVKTLPCYELTWSDGTVVTCSSEHPWLTRFFGEGSKTAESGGGIYHWRAAKDLRAREKGHGASRVVKPVDVWTEQDSETRQAGYLAGAFDGEGCYTLTPRAPRLQFAQNDNVMLDEVQKALKDLGFHYSLNEHRTPEGVKPQHYITMGRREDLLRFMGMVRPPRLLEKFDADRLGPMLGTRTVWLTAKRFVGEREVIAFGTTTKTFIAEGLASHNTEQVFNNSLDNYFLEARKADKSSKGGGFEGWKDWPVINKMYRGLMNALLRNPGHLFCTATADSVNFDQVEKDIRLLYGPHGVKPRGQKHTSHFFHTVLWKTSVKSGVWRLTTVKDRGRVMLETKEVGDFSTGYMIPVAKWRP